MNNVSTISDKDTPQFDVCILCIFQLKYVMQVGLPVEWTGHRVGHKRSMCHGIDILYQIVKEVSVRA